MGEVKIVGYLLTEKRRDVLGGKWTVIVLVEGKIGKSKEWPNSRLVSTDEKL